MIPEKVMSINNLLCIYVARAPGTPRYRSFHNAERDLSCLLLADLSLSTDAYVSNEQRIIDVVRDSLFLFSEALQATGDRFAMYGFSSRRRNHVRFHTLKSFDEPCNDAVRGRIQATHEHGLRPFCVTIDEKAGDYLPYLFGSASYVLVRNAGELPAKLPLLYARLTAS